MNRVCHMKREQSPMSPYNASVYCQRICLRGQNVEQNDLGIIRLMGVCVCECLGALIYTDRVVIFFQRCDYTRSLLTRWH